MKLNAIYLENKQRITYDQASLFILDTPGSNPRAKTFKLQPRRSAFVIGCALAILVSSPSADAFATTFTSKNNLSTQLYYRSLHHGPDVEPLTDIEKQGADFTKMPKDKLDRFGPGSFNQYADNIASNDLFDGGDSEMGLAGDGQLGLRQFGHDVSPHLVNTMAARYSPDKEAQTPHTPAMYYGEELMHSSPNEIRGVQLQNWATQQEIASFNKYMDEKTQINYDDTNYDGYIDYSAEEASFHQLPLEAGEETTDCLINLVAPINGVASHEILVKNPYLGFAKFRAGFVGDAAAEWTVTPSDGYLKQNEPTNFVVSYRPQNPGVVHGHLVIETEDHKNVWKVVGSTGEYEF